RGAAGTRFGRRSRRREPGPILPPGGGRAHGTSASGSMGRRHRIIRRTLIAALGAVLVATATLVATSRSDAAVAGVTLEGHGYGHGRGMGQWGAYGYALKGWNHRRIL